METTSAFTGLRCTDCGETREPALGAAGRCSACGATVETVYDYDAVEVSRADLADRSPGVWRYRELLPVPVDRAVSVDEGGTPLVACPDVADELGVARVLVKDEGRNATGSIADRGQTVAVSAARAAGATDVALPSPGDSGQAAAAYAARAGLDAHAFLPSRAGFVRKAMVNVHGADMTVVGGRYPDAEAACADAVADGDGWQSVAPFDAPFYVDGVKTALYEVVQDLDWTVPDAVVVPTGTGATAAAFGAAAADLDALGFVDAAPAIYAVQAEGCAPVVRAFEAGDDAVEPWADPDTICGEVEIPDPAGGDRALAALGETGGGAVATGDEDALASAVTVASHAGVEASVTGGVAASGAWTLAGDGAFDADDTVVIVNPGAGAADADVLRSHLMGRGV